MRLALLALLVASATAAPLGYEQASYNWDGTLQAPGGVKALDESRTENELGEAQMHGAGKDELDHQVIAMYEQHRWGWPGKESPEMQVPGSWSGDREIGESMHEAEMEESDPNAPVNPNAAKAHDPNRGAQTQKAAEAKYEHAIAARNAARSEFVSSPGNNILVASQQGGRAMHDVSRDRVATAAESKQVSAMKVLTPEEAAAKMDALRNAAPPKAAGKYDSKKYKPGKGMVIKKAGNKEVGQHHDIEVFDMDKMKPGEDKGVFKHNLLDDNIPPQKLAQMRAAKKAAEKNAPAPPAPGAVNVKALKAMWAKEEAQKRQAKRAAISKKAEQVELVPKVDLNARGLPERVHTQKTAGQATVQNNVVPAKPRQHPTGKMVTPAEAEKKLMKLEKSAELQGHSVNSPDMHYKPKHVESDVKPFTKAGYAASHPNE